MPSNLKTLTAASSTAKMAPDRKVRTAWNYHARNLVQAELARRGMQYSQLAQALEDFDGRPVSTEALTTRITRGTFTLAFFLQVARAIGLDSVDLRHLPGPSSRQTSKS